MFQHIKIWKRVHVGGGITSRCGPFIIDRTLRAFINMYMEFRINKGLLSEALLNQWRDPDPTRLRKKTRFPFFLQIDRTQLQWLPILISRKLFVKQKIMNYTLPTINIPNLFLSLSLPYSLDSDKRNVYSCARREAKILFSK